MDVNKLTEIKDGDSNRSLIIVEAPSILEVPKHKLDRSVSVKRKRRRGGKTKWQVSKPFLKVPWQDRRKIVNTKRNNRFRKQALSKTQAPFNNNQFLMEIHKPEPEDNLYLFRTPSARTRDSSFSVDSEENYFYSLPENEEEYLTKEFSSVYEDAQCERLAGMSKNELIQEYLLLEAKYDNLLKRTERCKPKEPEDIKETNTDKEMVVSDANITIPVQDPPGMVINNGSMEESTLYDAMQRLLALEQQVIELKIANEKLLRENIDLRGNDSSIEVSEDSESDSSSSSSCSSSSCSSPEPEMAVECNGEIPNGNSIDENGDHFANSSSPEPVVNGFHIPEPE